MTKQMISAFVSGLIFGMGVLISGMVNPDKVLAFLDIAGAWDPSLALVMAAAIAVALVAFTIAKRRTLSLLGEPMRLPQKKALDRRLVLGSLGFGVGWGLAGFCPAPALVAFAAGIPKAAVFVIAMMAGMAIYEALEKRTVHS